MSYICETVLRCLQNPCGRQALCVYHLFAFVSCSHACVISYFIPFGALLTVLKYGSFPTHSVVHTLLSPFSGPMFICLALMHSHLLTIVVVSFGQRRTAWN